MHWIDPDSLPEMKGRVERFLLNPHGEIDGFVMTSEANTPVLVHAPPHLEAEITRHLKPGDVVRVRGVRPRGANLFAAVRLTASNGTQIVDHGPDHNRKHPKLEKKKISTGGTVRLSLFGPKGELRGALLNDGTVIRIGPKEARQLAKLLAPGAMVAVSGDGLETEHGRVVHAKEIGSDPGRLRRIKAEKPKPKHGGKHGSKHDHEPEHHHAHEEART